MSRSRGVDVLERMLRDVTGIFIRQAVAYFQNALLHEEVRVAAITDPLTQLYNRRHFQNRVTEEFARANRQGLPLTIMISDLDNFKNCVDTYGHPQGDILLARVARVARDSLRATDIICRFGGDEFAYLLPFTSSQEARNVADRLLQRVAAHPFEEVDPAAPVRLTMSIGFASFPEHGDSQEEILRNADAALFTAKGSGKNTAIPYARTGGSS